MSALIWTISIIIALHVLAAVCIVSAATMPAGVHRGWASWYGESYRGKAMANGEPFDPDALTAASQDFPLGTRLRVTAGSRFVVVTVTDRGPTAQLRADGRIIDLSAGAYRQLASLRTGLVRVRLQEVQP